MIRVSTDEQAKNGESLETQTRELAGYAMMKGWTDTETFVEAGVSGSIPLAERPQGAVWWQKQAKGM
ncbi:recombinase family protein [Mesorhizobium sp. M0460]|uniref:recombinase family protein n=1 Tax=unclassified Mesorhizobium TaxID=325217 RepID=UPI00333D77A2